MRAALASFCRMLLLVLVAIGMILPASAWAMHEATHASQPVAANQHHHHDEATGEIALHDHDDGDEQGSDRGHDHMPGLIAALADLPTAQLDIAAPAPNAPLYFARTERSGHAALADRLRRPPRFA
jgi:hypothetical protein